MRKRNLVCRLLIFSVLSLGESQILAQESPGSGKRQIKTVVNLSGTVMQEDGNPPPGMLRVELVCDGTVREQALLDSSGNFSLQYGAGTRPLWEDASTAVVFDPTYGEVIRDEDPGMSDMRNTNLGQMNLSGCEIRAQELTDFRSDPIPLGPRSVFDDPDVGVIILQRKRRDTGMTANVTTLAAPPKAVRAYERARKAMVRKGKVDFSDVRKELEEAVTIYPKFAQAWHLLGNAHLRLGDQESARFSFEKAIAGEKTYIAPYVRLADLEVSAENFERAAELTSQVKEMRPGLPEVLYLDGLANYFLNRFKVARESFGLLDSSGHGENYPLSYCYLGMIESRSGDLEAASGRVRECLELAPDTVLPPKTRAELTRQIEIWEAEQPDKAKVVRAVEVKPGLILVGERELGIEFQDHRSGVLIRDVKWSGAAWVAGLRPGDLVVTVNGQRADRSAFGQLFLELARGTADQGTFTVWRKGGELVFQTRRVQSAVP